MRIFDNVDVHVKVLERMYHKRLRGYAELGYQAKAGDGVEQTSVIFDTKTLYKPFSGDLADMEREALMISPFMRKARVTSLYNLMALPIKQGATITIITRPPEDYKPDQQA